MEDLIEAYLSVYEESDIDEAMIVRKGTSTNAAGQQVPWTHTHNTATGRSSVKDKFGERDATTSSVKRDKTPSARIKSRMAESADLYDLVLDHLLDEGYADTEDNAITIMANMSEEWIDEIIDEAADNVIMTVKSPSGQERSKIRKGASRPSDYHRHENPEQIANRRFSQQLADIEKERQARMSAGRLTVATKRGIQAATNRSNDGVGGNTFVHGSSLRARERDDVPTDYRARRRRASGR